MTLHRPLIVPLMVAVGLVAAAAGCRSEPSTPGGHRNTSPSAFAGTPTASSSTATGGAAPTTSATPIPSASPVLADGRSAVYLTGIDVTHRTLTFDLIEFLTGDAAKKAWQKANPNSGQDGPDNDYFIVNDNPRLRTLPVAATASVNVLKNGGGSPESYAVSLANLPGYLAQAKPDDRRLSYNPFWLTIRNGQIVRIDEQFVP
jgi:hypothetical protein